MPTAFSRTSRRSFGSALPWRSHQRRVMGGATSRIARRADFFITLASAQSWKTGRMSRARVEPAGPAVARRIDAEPGEPAVHGTVPQFSTRWKYRRMRSARHDASPVRAAMASQSASCGAMKIIALCAVQPPGPPPADTARHRPSDRSTSRGTSGPRAAARRLVVPDEEAPRHRLVLEAKAWKAGTSYASGRRLPSGSVGSPPPAPAGLRRPRAARPVRPASASRAAERSAAGARADHDVLALRGAGGFEPIARGRPRTSSGTRSRRACPRRSGPALP
jgi:hypothetical protein